MFSAGLGALTGAGSGGVIAGGLIGGVASTVADGLVKNVTYSLIVDVQVSAKLPKGESAKTQTVANAANGSVTRTRTQFHGTTHRVPYSTRIVTVANQANLNFEKAKPVLLKQLGRSIASIF